MKKLTKTASKRLTLSSESVRTLNNPRLLTEDQTRRVAGGQPPTFGMCGHGCDCSSMECVG